MLRLHFCIGRFQDLEFFEASPWFFINPIIGVKVDAYLPVCLEGDHMPI